MITYNKLTKHTNEQVINNARERYKGKNIEIIDNEIIMDGSIKQENEITATF